MTLAEVVQLTNENPGLASLVGSAVGGAFAGATTGLVVGWKVVRKRWRREAYGVARNVVREHAATCPRVIPAR